MPHLNDLNVSLQGETRTIIDLIPTIRAFLKKFEFFKDDIQSQLHHFPRPLEQNTVKAKMKETRYVQLIEKLIANIAMRLGEFPKIVAAVSWKPFFADRHSQIINWSKSLTEFLENAAVKKIFYDGTPENFWSKVGISKNFPILQKLAVQILTVFGLPTAVTGVQPTQNFLRGQILWL